MLYTVCRNMILLGKTEDLEPKLDVFYAVGKLTDAEYNELIGMLHPNQEVRE